MHSTHILVCNSSPPGERPAFSVEPFRPAAAITAAAGRELSRATGEGGDMINFSYSHGKPSNSSDVMPALMRTFVVPKSVGAEGGMVTASGSVDDSVSLAIDGHCEEDPRPGARHSFSLSIGGLAPGYHSLSLVHSNITYYPDPYGNVSLISGTVGPCPAVTIVPEKNKKVMCLCGVCTPEGSGDAGGAAPEPALLAAAGPTCGEASPSRAALLARSTALGSSSGGGGVVREAKVHYMRFAFTFGSFRGMGGIPQGQLELIGYRYGAELATPSAMAYRHPAATALAVPEGGIAPNELITLYEGNAATNYLCDANGASCFGVGSTASETAAVRFVSACDRSEAVETPLATARYLRVAKTDGSATFYHLATGLFAACISPQGALLTEAEAARHLAVLRESDGTIRQIWNWWDGLADIEANVQGGFTISLYLPGQVTGIDAATGLYLTAGDPFKTFTVTDNAAAKTLTVTERDGALPASFPDFVSTWSEEQGTWSLTLGAGNEAIVTRRTRNELAEEGAYRIVTTQSKAGVAASCVAEDFLSHATGELLLARTEGYGTPGAQTTVSTYDDAGRLLTVVDPGGGRTSYVYDAAGRVIIVTSPWAGGSRLVQTTYRADGSGYSDEPTQIDDNLVDAAGVAHLHRREVYAYSLSGSVKRVEKRTTVGGITQLEITETWQGDAANPFARGRVKMTQAADGVQTWHDYAAASAPGVLYTETIETRVEGEFVAGQSTRQILSITAEGNAVREEEWILDSANAWCQLAAADYEYDAQNRWIKRTRSNGRTSTRTLICTGEPLTETDEDGIRTDYAYDSARRLVETTRSATETTPETITVFTRDALGRATRTVTQTGAMETVETADFDLLGRPTAQTDLLGRTTAFAYSADGLTTTMTTPAGATLATVRHPDGSIVHEYGTGGRETHTIYDVNANNARATVRLGAPGGGGAILSQQIQNGFGQIITVTSPTTLANGYLYDRATYDARGLLSQTVRNTGSGPSAPSMAPILYAYDDFGNRAQKTLKLADEPTVANSDIEAYAYAVENRADGVYRVTTVTRCNGNGGTYAETTAELLSENPLLASKTILTDARGNATTHWEEYGEGPVRLQKSAVPGATQTAVTTMVDGFATEEIDHVGLVATRTRTYTAIGQHLEATDERGNTTRTQTDLAGRTTSITDAAGHTTATAYDPCFDQPATVTDALGHTACFRYDNRGRRVAAWGTGIQPALMSYDEADRLIALTTYRAVEEEVSTDPAARSDGDLTQWTYHDATGLAVKKTYADGSCVTQTYDAMNRPALRTNARGTTLACTYEQASGLLTAETPGDATTPARRYTWNNVGRLTTVADASGTHTLAYNDYGEPESDTLKADGNTHALTETRDALGRNDGYTYAKDNAAQQTVGWHYDSANDLINGMWFLHGGEKKTFRYNRVAGSRLMEAIFHPNNIAVTYAYEAKRNLPLSMNITRGTTNVVLRGYSYDALGRPATRSLARQAKTRADAFTYNNRSELAGATLGASGYNYSYDNIGNRKTAEEAAAPALAYTANNLNQYTAIGEATAEDGAAETAASEEAFAPVFDAGGNQTRIRTATGIWSVTYDADDRPVSFTSEDGQTVIECGYDYLGRRYMKKVTSGGAVTLHQRFIYRGYLQIAALDMLRASHPVLWLLAWDPTEPQATRPLALQKNGTWYTYGHDLTKNVTEVFKSDGTIATAYDYAPFGAITASGIEQPIQWSSEYYDSELGLVYYNFRHYNTLDGRWITRDPIGEETSFNLYTFVENEVIEINDILGLQGLGGPGCHYNSPTCGNYGTNEKQVRQALVIGSSLYGATLLARVVVGVAGARIIGQGAKKELERKAKRKTKEITECEAIHTAYKIAEQGAKHCTRCLSKGVYLAKLSSRAAEIAGRLTYLKKKCDYKLPYSIVEGSSFKEKRHREQVIQSLGAFKNCISTAVASGIPYSELPHPPTINI